MMGGDGDLKAMRPAPPVKEYETGGPPLMILLRELLKRSDLRHVEVKGKNYSLLLRK